MAHFAELGLDNIVKRVVVIHNNELLDGDGVEQESLGIAFCEQLFGGTWVQTSYNGNIRKNYAGVGYTYNSSLDAFIPPKPYASWTLDETTCQWQAPVAMPVDDNFYIWNETDQTWDLVGE
jgi:hypothetical protein